MGFNVCENFESDEDIRDLTIGYAKNSRVLFIIIPSFAIVANLAVIVNYFLKKTISKRHQASMEKLLFDLTLVEAFISFYWLCNGIFFYKGSSLKDNCEGCFAASICAIFLHCFDWIFLTATIYHLKIIITNPIEGILKTEKKIRKYEIIAFLGGALFALLSYMAKVYGRSPMITCFIRTDFLNIDEKITVFFFFVIPVVTACYGVYLTMSMLCNKTLAGDFELRKLFYKYVTYIGVYLFFNTPIFLLYLSSIYFPIHPNTFLSWFSYFSCVMCCSVPLVITCIRILQGYVRIDFWKRCKNTKRLRSVINTTVSEGLVPRDDGLRKAFTEKQEFEWLESRIMENFMRDIFVGICYFLKMSSINSPTLPKISKRECRNTREAQITFDNINFDDEFVKNSQYLDVNVIEFAPNVFSTLRHMETLSELDMINSLLPMKNRTTINQSQGRSGNFFICTDDNKYILKTVTSDELELIRCMLLKKFTKHLERYQNSILCRFYGLYKMILSNGDEVIVMLMRNVIGAFKENVMCKYDLKGSSVNRKERFECDKVEKIVMKDVNFEEIEKMLLLSKFDIERLRFAVSSDAYFLNDIEIMDYSLFVVKLSLSRRDVISLFGEKERSNSEQRLLQHFPKEDTEQSSLAVNSTSLDQDISLDDINFYHKYLFPSLSPTVVYIIAIIDYLQLYNFAKYIETNLKYYIKDRPDKVEAISSVPPNVYCTRFIEYVNRITDSSSILKNDMGYYSSDSTKEREN